MVGLSIWFAVAFLGIAVLFLLGHAWGFAVLAVAIAGLTFGYTGYKAHKDGAES